MSLSKPEYVETLSQSQSHEPRAGAGGAGGGWRPAWRPAWGHCWSQTPGDITE